jgi:hypothetical protein
MPTPPHQTRAGAWARLLTAGLLIPVAAATLPGQRGGFGRSAELNPPYDGRFTFTRLSYGGGGGGFRRGWASAWNHDYPQADMYLPKILDALTSIETTLGASNVFDLEDNEIFRNPILYMWEPGFWQVTERGAANLRAYMLKGGTVIFDDFEADQWFNFERQFRLALPEAEFVRLDTSHPLFHSFFDMNEINLPHPSVRVEPAYYAVFENNDSTRRIMAIALHNSDVAEYWEWSDRGYFPVDTTNDAFKLGVNLMIYALTH